MERILVVDDERDLCEILQFNLLAAGYQCDIAYSAEDALLLMREGGKNFDLLFLDVMMDGMSGFELAQCLQGSGIPIIFLTAKDTEDDLLEGFRLGADDYIAKPFSVREVLARVRAVLLRTAKASTLASSVLSCEGLVMNLESKSVMVDGEMVAFTRTEFDLLRLFLSEPGRVFSRQQLIDKVWPKDVIVTDRAVDVNITRLRKKVGQYASRISTRLGFGYYFDDSSTK